MDAGRRIWSPELLPQGLEALVRGLIWDQPTLWPQADTGERQQQHQRLVGCPTAMASIDPDGGQALKELFGGHLSSWQGTNSIRFSVLFSPRFCAKV